MNDRTGNLTARGNVRTDDDARGRGSEDQGPQAHGNQRERRYAGLRDAKRLATYTATGTTPASLKSAQGDLSGNRIDLYLKEGGSELERAEADGNVAVKLETIVRDGQAPGLHGGDRHLRADGRPVMSVKKDEHGVVQGDARQHDDLPARGRQHQRRRPRPESPTETKPMPACPAELASLNGDAADAGPDQVLRRAHGRPRRQPRRRLGRGRRAARTERRRQDDDVLDGRRADGARLGPRAPRRRTTSPTTRCTSGRARASATCRRSRRSSAA